MLNLERVLSEVAQCNRRTNVPCVPRLPIREWHQSSRRGCDTLSVFLRKWKLAFLETVVTCCQAPVYSWFMKCCKSGSPRWGAVVSRLAWGRWWSSNLLNRSFLPVAAGGGSCLALGSAVLWSGMFSLRVPLCVQTVLLQVWKFLYCT